MYWPLASLTQTYKYAIGIAVLLVVFGIVLPKRNRTAIALVIMLAGFAWFGAFEWFRESLRKPYVIDSYMYANAAESLHEADYRRDGYLAHIRYRTGDAGADLFLHACGSCHTIDGYRGLARSFDGTDRQFIAHLVRDTEKMRGSMPPFMGTQAEADQIASWVWDRVEHRPLADLTGLSGVALGKKVYEVRCGNCHVIGGFNDKWPTLQGMSAVDYGDVLDSAGDFSPMMPPFTAPPQERQALIAYFVSLNGGNR